MASRYKAFLSYSHADKAAVEWLFRRLENYRTPRALIGAAGHWGPAPDRLAPVFRDREELTAAAALGERLTAALQSSEFLIVACSPAAARSRWVNEEIRSYRAFHGAARVIPVIVAGDPGAPVGEGLPGCFPPALLEPDAPGGPPQEPIAADLRGEGDGRRFGFLKLAAGLLGVGLDDLVHREARRRQRVQWAITAVSSTITFILAGITLYAVEQRREAERQRLIAEDQRDTATAALDYLTGIFEIANPATENARTITALTVLDRGLKRIDAAFADKPAVQAKLLGVMGEVYANLGALDAARATLQAAIDRPGGALADRLSAEFRLADLLTKAMQLGEAESLLARVEAELAAATLDPSERALQQGRLAERRGDILWSSARDAEALARYAEAKAAFTAAGPAGDVFRARAASTSGIILARMKRFDEAERELTEARAGQLALHGPDHLETAIADHNLAYMHFEAGDATRAAADLNRAIAIYSKVLEPTHPTVSTAALLLGRILEKAGDPAAAVAAHIESVRTAKAAYGEGNENVGYRLLYLARAQAEAGRPADGLATLEEAQAIYDARFPPGDFNHGDLSVYRALVLAAAGRRDEARTLCADGLATLERNLEPADAYLAEMAAECAKIE